MKEFHVHVVHDGESDVVEAVLNRYSIVVLDIMMPRLSGIGAL